MFSNYASQILRATTFEELRDEVYNLLARCDIPLEHMGPVTISYTAPEGATRAALTINGYQENGGDQTTSIFPGNEGAGDDSADGTHGLNPALDVNGTSTFRNTMVDVQGTVSGSTPDVYGGMSRDTNDVITFNASAVIGFNVAMPENGVTVDLGNDKLVIEEAGTYLIHFTASCEVSALDLDTAPDPAAGDREAFDQFIINLRINGSVVSTGDPQIALDLCTTFSNSQSGAFVWIATLAVNDEIDIRGIISSPPRDIRFQSACLAIRKMIA